MRLFGLVVLAVVASASGIPPHLGTLEIDQRGFPRLPSHKEVSPRWGTTTEHIPSWLWDGTLGGEPHRIRLIHDFSGVSIADRPELKIVYVRDTIGHIRAYEAMRNIFDHVDTLVYFSLPGGYVIYAVEDVDRERQWMMNGRYPSILRFDHATLNFSQLSSLLKSCLEMVFSLPHDPSIPMPTIHQIMMSELFWYVEGIHVVVGERVETYPFNMELLERNGISPENRFKVAMSVMLQIVHGEMMGYEVEPTEDVIKRAFFQEGDTPEPLRVNVIKYTSNRSQSQVLRFRPMDQVLKGAFPDATPQQLCDAFGAYIRYLNEVLQGDIMPGSIRALDEHMADSLDSVLLK